MLWIYKLTITCRIHAGAKRIVIFFTFISVCRASITGMKFFNVSKKLKLAYDITYFAQVRMLMGVRGEFFFDSEMGSFSERYCLYFVFVLYKIYLKTTT